MSSEAAARPLRVALTGVRRSGKSTVASRLNCQVLSFAAPLKEIVQKVFPAVNWSHLYDPDHKETIIAGLGVSGRQLMQVVGTDLFRDTLMEQLPGLADNLTGGTVWINALMTQIEALPLGVGCVVDDCRFPDEYAALKRAGFTVIHLQRKATGVQDSAVHASEKGCPSDHVIDNDGTIDELMQEVHRVIGLHGKG